MQRNSLTQEEALVRIRSQMKLLDKVKLATYCLDNSGDLDDLAKQVGHLVPRVLGG